MKYSFVFDTMYINILSDYMYKCTYLRHIKFYISMGYSMLSLSLFDNDVYMYLIVNAY